MRGKIRTISYSDRYWDRFPDLNFPNFQVPNNPLDAPDQFFFHPVFKTGDGRFYHPTYSDSWLLAICDNPPGCLATYHGQDGKTGLDVEFVLNSFDFNNGIAELSVWAFNETVASTVENYNPESFARVMMTHPDGVREMLEYDWETHTSVERDEDGNAATWFRVEGLDDSLCYQFDLVGLIVTETELSTFWEDNKLTWTGMTDPIFIGCSD